MRSLRLMRGLASGMPCMLLAALMLFSRLIAPAMALPMAGGDPVLRLVEQTICHTDASGEAPARTDHPGHHDCLLCPACHLASHAVLPTPAPPTMPLPTLMPIDAGAPLPPATGPPSRIRTASQPTGPPHFSV